MFIMALSVTAPNWKQLKCLTIGKWLKKLWYIQSIEHKLMATKGEKGQERDKLGVWDQQIQTTTCKIDKTRSYCTGHRTILSILWWTIMEKNIYTHTHTHTYISWITLLYTRNENNIVSQLYYNLKKIVTHPYYLGYLAIKSIIKYN